MCIALQLVFIILGKYSQTMISFYEGTVVKALMIDSKNRKHFTIIIMEQLPLKEHETQQ